MPLSLLRMAAVALVFVLAACGDGAKQQAAGPPPPTVTVANPVQKAVTDYDEYVGRFVALDSVEVRARVSGYLDQVNFTDGQLVQKGDLLFTIDARPFRNTLEQANANLTSARANLAFAEADLERGSQLARDKTITQQTFDQRTQAKRVAEANVAAQEAAVSQAALDLEFTTLRAPMAGRIGDRRVSPGNLITGGTAGNTTMLASIVSMDPIRLEFTFDEASYLRYQRLSKPDDDTTTGRRANLPVSLKLIDEREFVHEGYLDFVDNTIDRASGTIRGRAVFSNSKNLFTPGMFGRIRIPASAQYTALLVPDAAIGTEQVKKFVYVVGADGTVAQKFIVSGQLVGDLRVVKEGVSATDRVVVNGQMRAKPGQKVTPQQDDAAASAGPTAQRQVSPPAKTD
ncbi:MAG: efflux RND transporter periplasmic adaptor subunit [Xanthobacteraceae bacterium]